MTRDEHLKAIKIIAYQKRGKRGGLLMLCSGPDCAGAEVWVPGIDVLAVYTACNRHVDETEEGDVTCNSV